MYDSHSDTTDNTLLSIYADAQSALVQIEERRRLSPVRSPWKIRCFIAERQALAWIDATAIDTNAFYVDGRGSVIGTDFDLTHWRQAVGAAITIDTLLTDSARLVDWFGIDDVQPTATIWSTPALSRTDIQSRIEQWQREISALPPSPPLLHSARLALAWRRRAPIGRGDIVASLLVGDRYGPGRWDASFGGLVALGLRTSNAAWKVAEGRRLDHIWLKAIVQGARDHLDQEMRLRSYAARAAAVIADRRRPGRLKEVIMMAMAHPYITSRSVADRLTLTSAGAIKLLGIAVDTGLLLERSGQSSYRTYAIPVTDGGPISSSQRRPNDLHAENFWADD